MTGPLRAALIGHPVRHSLSPTLHQAAGAACGVAVDYRLIDVPPGGVAEAIARLRAAGLRGINVTAPHKAEATACADRLTDAARAIGVVNTLAFDPDGVLGDNTDGPGFSAALGALPGPRAAVIGAGGAARAVVWALLDAGAARIDVLNRDPERARALCDALDPARARPGPLAATARLAGADLLVVAIPNAGSAALALPFDALAPHARIVGLDYGRRAEPLRRAVGGIRPFSDGLGMLAWQGVLAFARWTGREPPIGPVREALAVAAATAD